MTDVATELLTVDLTVNGERVERAVQPRISLADFLRDELQLTGTKLGCEHGVCGACTVIVDGAAVRSCLMLAVQAGGCDVRTVESLASGPQLSPLQEAFHRHHALQCGFCTGGVLMTATALLHHNPSAGKDEIREALSANLCRCTGYQTIIDAIAEVADGGLRAMAAGLAEVPRPGARP
ncbi:MAG TPA: (2Fe-2S)-binding protein [Gaiellaceae bacterium]|nr:(2Fe-2S)-binding protein [Gaiellaceae bacterium]